MKRKNQVKNLNIRLKALAMAFMMTGTFALTGCSKKNSPSQDDAHKIVGTTDFEIGDIKNNSKFNIDVKLPSTLVINDNEESLLEYDKIEIYYTFAY